MNLELALRFLNNSEQTLKTECSIAVVAIGVVNESRDSFTTPMATTAMLHSVFNVCSELLRNLSASSRFKNTSQPAVASTETMNKHLCWIRAMSPHGSALLPVHLMRCTGSKALPCGDIARIQHKCLFIVSVEATAG